MSFSVVTKLWVEALVRRASLAGAFSVIERVGDAERGDVIIKTRNQKGEISLIGRAFSGGDDIVFEHLSSKKLKMTETEAQDFLKSRISFDPDIWIVEIEDKEGRHFITERVLPIIPNDPFA